MVESAFLLAPSQRSQSRGSNPFPLQVSSGRETSGMTKFDHTLRGQDYPSHTENPVIAVQGMRRVRTLRFEPPQTPRVAVRPADILRRVPPQGGLNSPGGRKNGSSLSIINHPLRRTRFNSPDTTIPVEGTNSISSSRGRGTGATHPLARPSPSTAEGRMANASGFTDTFEPSSPPLSPSNLAMALTRPASLLISSFRKKYGHARNLTFGQPTSVVEDGTRGIEECVKAFEEKYQLNMVGMKRDIGAFYQLRLEEFGIGRLVTMSSWEDLERKKKLETTREAFRGDSSLQWAFTALREMALEDAVEPGKGRTTLGELYAFLEVEGFVQQVAMDQAKAGESAALQTDTVVGGAVEVALQACADDEIAASRERVKEALGIIRRIAVDEMVAAREFRAAAELLFICADLEVRVGGYKENSQQVLTTRYYAEVLQHMQVDV